MQLCICINCFLKALNKQLNQYCLNFTIFFFTKKKSFKKMVRVQVGLTHKKHWSGHGSTRFCFGSKKFGFESNQKILTRFAMSTHRPSSTQLSLITSTKLAFGLIEKASAVRTSDPVLDTDRITDQTNPNIYIIK